MDMVTWVFTGWGLVPLQLNRTGSRRIPTQAEEIMKNSVLGLTTALFFIGLLNGCGAPPSEESNIASTLKEDPYAKKVYPSNIPQEWVPFDERDMGDHLILSMDAEPAHLNTILDTADASSNYIAGFIYETLLNVEPETLEMIPNLAKSWEISDDHLTYTFKLRDDVTFSDGVPLTAHDVKFTHELIDNPENDSASSRNYLQDIENIDVLDDHTIRYTMSKIYFRHLIVLGLNQVFPKHIFENGELNTHPNNRNPIGSGPYVFEKWDTGQRIVLSRNENYWGDKQPIAKRIWKVITNDNSAFLALVGGDTDTYRVKPDKWEREGSSPEFEEKFNKFTPDSPIPGYFSRYNYIGWNSRKPQFEDKRVRQALCMLFDRDLIIDEVWGGLATKITGPMFHKAPEYNQNVTAFPFDPAGAIALLEEAGWVDGDRDGIREKNGVKLEFELGFGANVPEYERLGTVYQEELKRAGINMLLAPLEWATFQERLHKRNFDACMLAWLTPIAQDPYQLWHSTQAANGSNYPGLQIEEVDTILETAREELDAEKRRTKYHRLHEILHEEQPYLFLYARPGLIAFDKRFSGVVEHNAGLDPLDWWVAAKVQKYQ
jgi:peptide/nickel transport system substrate-binding protein